MKQFIVSVTGCDNCPHHDYIEQGYKDFCGKAPNGVSQEVYEQNKDAITKTCPEYSRVHEQFKVDDWVDFNEKSIKCFGTVEHPVNKLLSVNKEPFKIAGIIHTLDNQLLFFQNDGQKTTHPFIANGVTNSMYQAYADPLKDWYSSSFFKKVYAPVETTEPIDKIVYMNPRNLNA